jgi:hypothetical protein
VIAEQVQGQLVHQALVSRHQVRARLFVAGDALGNQRRFSVVGVRPGYCWYRLHSYSLGHLEVLS